MPLRLQVVPTFVLVNNRGDVITSTEGVLTDAQQRNFVHAANLQVSRR